jgi:hypothetical protein
MADRKRSDEVAAIAGRLLAKGDPLKDPRVVDRIIKDLALANNAFDARKAVRAPLRQFIDDAISLAGSVVSQADGQE